MGMLILLGLSLGAGWSAGAQDDENRKAVALTTAIRNVGLGPGDHSQRLSRRLSRDVGRDGGSGLRAGAAARIAPRGAPMASGVLAGEERHEN